MGTRRCTRLATGLALAVLAACGGEGGDAVDRDAADGPSASFAAVEPADGARGVSPSALVHLRFRGAVDETTLAAGVRVVADGREIATRPHRVSATHVILDPVEALPGARTVEVVLRPGLRAGTETLAERQHATFETARQRFGPVVRFDPLGGELRPFPSDLYLADDASRPSGRRIEIDTRHVPSFIGLGREALMDGFDPNGRILLGLTGAVDPGSLPEPAATTDLASPVLLVRADPSDPRFGERAGVIPRNEELGLTQNPPDPMLMLRPLAPLDRSTRYAAIVTRRVRGIDGADVEPSELLVRMLAGDDVGPRLAPYAERVRSTVDALSDLLPLGREDVAGITVFTTASEAALTDDMVVLTENLTRTADLFPPRFRVERVEPDDELVLVTGRMTAYEFRGPDGLFERARFATVPLAAPSVELEILVALPADAVRAPVVQFGHGINSEKGSLRAVARDLAAHGIATVGVDFVEHGDRFEGGTIPAIAFLNLDFLPGWRDNARQTVADMLQLSRLAERDLDALDLLPLGDPDGIPDVDGSRLGYMGVSFGAIHGTMVSALDPSIRAAALIVGGGAWTDVAYEFPPLTPGNDGFDLLGELAGRLGLPVSEVFTLIAVGQHMVAPGDPLTYAQHLVNDRLPTAERPRSVYQVEVMDDDVVPNLTNESLARAIGVPLLRPERRPVPGIAHEDYPVRANGPGRTTVGLVQYEYLEDGTRATHNSVFRQPDIRQQAAAFLAEALAGVPPTIARPLAQR